MKYLCLIYSDETVWPKMPKAEADKWLAEYFAFGDSIKQSGQYVGSNALQPTHTATTVRVRNGKLSGSLLIEARDLKEAIQAAATMPMARRGSIEVWPIKELLG